MLPILLLGGLGFLMVSLIDELSDETDSSKEEENDILGAAIEIPTENAVENYVADLNNSGEAEMDETRESIEPFIQAPLYINPEEGNIGEVDQLAGQNILSIDSTSLIDEDTSSPLDDFNSNQNTPIINFDELDYINIDIDPELGRVGILRADYYERYDDENGLEAEALHTGVNFYFIPEGDHYPNDYLWSNDGASLYNNESNSNDPADFGNIRLILRVDTGTLYNAASYEVAQNFSDETFETFEPIIIGEGIRFEL